MPIKHTITYFKSHSDVANPLHYQLTFHEFIDTLSNVKTHADKGSAGVMVAGYATYRNNEQKKTRSMITIDVDDIHNTINLLTLYKYHLLFTYLIYHTNSH